MGEESMETTAGVEGSNTPGVTIKDSVAANR